MASKKTKERKQQLWNEIQDACCEYDKLMFVNTDNVTSKQICIMRKSMREIDALMICGKNTMMKKAISQLNTPPMERDKPEENNDGWEHRPHLDKIVQQLKGNISIIFTNGELVDILGILDSQVREAPARIGSLAPKDVTIPAGPTGLDPRQTGFFGNLGIATKIVKAQIEILNPHKIISEGDKISPGQSALLDKLKIRPFEYKMTVRNIMQDGSVFPPAVLKITTEDVLAKFQNGVNNLTALSLGSGYVVPSAAPHLIMRAFKNLAAVTFATDFTFPEAAALKSAAAAGPAKAVPPEGSVVRPPSKEPTPEPSEEEADVDMGDLFGGGDY